MSSEFPSPSNEPAENPPEPKHIIGADDVYSNQELVPRYTPPVGAPSANPKRPVTELRGNQGLVFVSWLVILGLTTLIFGSTTYFQFVMPPDQGSQDISKAELMTVNLQGKMLLGSKLVLGEQMMAASAQQLDALNVGPPESRYSASILTNEFLGSESALEQLEQVDKLIVSLNYEPTEKQQRLREIVGTLFENYDDGDFDSEVIPKQDREFLKTELGWVGELALVPKETPHGDQRTRLEQDAWRSTVITYSALAAGIVALLIGLLTAFIFMVMSASGTLKPTFPPQSTHGRIYAETFALWFVLFWGAQVGLAVLANDLLTDAQAFGAMLVIFFASLAVLAWPLIRGLPFSNVREDIGWKLKNPLVEAACAVVSYISILPFLAGSLILVMILLVVTTALQQNPDANELSSVTSAGHPIQEQFAAGDPTLVLFAFLALCVAAPIVEETMFRGVLYRHLRDATTGWQKFASVIFSAVVSSMIFASVHPQGIIGIPLLGTLAMGFALVREWRDSLIAPMIMHAINNGCVATLLFLIL